MIQKNLFVIDGAAGTGKTDLLEMVQNHEFGSNCVFLKKFTTRSPRTEEDKGSIDLVFVEEAEFQIFSEEQYFYHYYYPTQKGKRYGFRKNELENCLMEKDNVFLIIRSARVIMDIIRDFPGINIVPLFIYTRPDTIAKRLSDENYNEEQILFRISRSAEAFRDYNKYPTLYSDIILNDSDKDKYQQQVRLKINKYLNAIPSVGGVIDKPKTLPSFLEAHKDEIATQLKKNPYDKNILLMTDSRTRNRIENLIGPIVQTKGYNLVHSDMARWMITRDDILNPHAVLACCKYGIAIFNNYETIGSYDANTSIEAHTMFMHRKRCLVIRHKELPSPPRNLSFFRFHDFSTIEDLMPLTKDWLSTLKY